MNTKKSNGKNVGAIVTTVVGTIVAITPTIDTIINELEKRALKEPNNVMIPPLYDKGFPLKLDQAITALTDVGLKVIPSELSLKEAAPKYKDYVDNQVVSSNPKHKQKVPVASSVIIRYITQEVVDKSQMIFEEIEKQRIKMKRMKAEKKGERMEQAQKIITGAASSAKDGFEKILPQRRHRTTESDKK